MLAQIRQSRNGKAYHIGGWPPKVEPNVVLKTAGPTRLGNPVEWATRIIQSFDARVSLALTERTWIVRPDQTGVVNRRPNNGQPHWERLLLDKRGAKKQRGKTSGTRIVAASSKESSRWKTFGNLAVVQSQKTRWSWLALARFANLSAVHAQSALLSLFHRHKPALTAGFFL